MEKELKNKSVVNVARIAREYGYKTEVVRCGNGLAFLSISDNFLKSPYPRHITSDIRCAGYVESMVEKHNI